MRRETNSTIEPEPILRWLEQIAQETEPTHFSKRLSRDPSDNIFVGTALAAQAHFIVSYDPDLLVLQKPFGVEILRSREFLRKV